MTNYTQHLYNYAEIKRKTPNRKLLLNWIQYITDNNIPDGECYKHSTNFMLNHPSITGKTKNTKRNYNNEIDKFNEYIYQQEGWPLPWEEPITPTETKKQEPNKNKICTFQKIRQEQNTTPEQTIDKEYQAFLDKYENLTRGRKK